MALGINTDAPTAPTARRLTPGASYGNVITGALQLGLQAYQGYQAQAAEEAAQQGYRNAQNYLYTNVQALRGTAKSGTDFKFKSGQVFNKAVQKFGLTQEQAQQLRSNLGQIQGIVPSAKSSMDSMGNTITYDPLTGTTHLTSLDPKDRKPAYQALIETNFANSGDVQKQAIGMLWASGQADLAQKHLMKLVEYAQRMDHYAEVTAQLDIEKKQGQLTKDNEKVAADGVATNIWSMGHETLSSTTHALRGALVRGGMSLPEAIEGMRSAYQDNIDYLSEQGQGILSTEEITRIKNLYKEQLDQAIKYLHDSSTAGKNEAKLAELKTINGIQDQIVLQNLPDSTKALTSVIKAVGGVNTAFLSQMKEKDIEGFFGANNLAAAINASKVSTGVGADLEAAYSNSNDARVDNILNNAVESATKYLNPQDKGSNSIYTIDATINVLEITKSRIEESLKAGEDVYSQDQLDGLTRTIDALQSKLGGIPSKK